MPTIKQMTRSHRRQYAWAKAGFYPYGSGEPAAQGSHNVGQDLATNFDLSGQTLGTISLDETNNELRIVLNTDTDDQKT